MQNLKNILILFYKSENLIQSHTELNITQITDHLALVIVMLNSVSCRDENGKYLVKYVLLLFI